MLKNILKIALRSFYRDKSFSIINLSGLAIGIVAFIFIIQYATFEMSYDNFHVNGDNIYKVSRHEYGENLELASANAFYAIGPEAFENFPEVLNFTRMHPADGMITYSDEIGNAQSFFEDKSYYVDTSFFDIFSFPLVQGDPETILQNPSSVVVSESAAKKYFGDVDPIGKVLNLTTQWQGGDYVVEGVFKDIPANSHLSFDFIFPIHDLLSNFQFDGKGWQWVNFYNYLLVKPDANIGLLEEKLSELPEKYLSTLLEQHQMSMEFHLQAVPDINLYAELSGETKESGKWKQLRILIIAAFFIIGLAWLNYINLTTARAIKRSKEIGLRKVMGSNRLMLIKQFLLESLFINAIAIVLAMVVLLLTIRFLNQMVNEPLSFNWHEQYRYWILFIVIFIGGTLLSGFYPAIYLSSLKPVQALKGKMSVHRGKNYLRQTLVVIQFTISLSLMVGAAIIYNQVMLMQQQDLGMNITHKLIVKAPRTAQKGYWSELNAFKNEVTKKASVVNAAVSFEIPGHDLFWGAEVNVVGGEQHVTVQRTSFDADFIPVYDIDIVAGRNFTRNAEGAVALINEAALKVLGFSSAEEALDKELDDGWYPRKIVGVIGDYHQRSPKFRIEPLVISPFMKEQGYITLSVQEQHVQETLAYVEDVYKTMFPANAFEYFFLDEYFQQQFESDKQFGQVVTLFSGLAIFIAGLGLLGFTSYLSNSRAKEVGVRKVLGAGSGDIFYLFNKSIIKLVLIAGIISFSIIYFVAQKWLENYATRIELKASYLALPCVIMLIVSMTITTIQIVKIIRTNAVDLLRYE